MPLDGNAIIAAINSATATINADRLDPSVLLVSEHHDLSVTDHNDFFTAASSSGVDSITNDGDVLTGSVAIEEDTSPYEGINIRVDSGQLLIGIDHSVLEGKYVTLTTNQIVAGQKTWSDDAVFQQNVTIGGDLYVNGTTTTINTTNMDVEDNIITLNNGETGAGVSEGSAGISIDRGSLNPARLIFDEIEDRWKIDTGTGVLYEIWHEDNDGSGSGLDADYLDGYDSSDFALVTDLSNYVAKAGDTMSGNLSMGSNYITDLHDPVNAQDAATKAYVDSVAGSSNDYHDIFTVDATIISNGYVDTTFNILSNTETVSKNGVVLTPGPSYDYTVSGNRVTLYCSLVVGDLIHVRYSY